LLLKMTFNASSWSVREEFNQAELKLVIPNSVDVVGQTKKGQIVSSKQFAIGGSKLALAIYLNGEERGEEGTLSAFLSNESSHDVVVDCTICTILVEGGNGAWHRMVSGENSKLKKGHGWRKMNFMRANEVGTDLKTTVEVKLKWADISGGVGEHNQSNSRELGQVEARLGGKLEQMKTLVLAELDQQHQQMKNFVRGEIAKVKVTPIPECPVCFQHLTSPKKIVQCLKGHKICEACSENEAVESCPTCKTAFIGRDYGMEAFIKELIGED